MNKIISQLLCLGDKQSKVITNSSNFDIKPLIGEPFDYSNKDNWLRYIDNPTKDIDTIFFLSTCITKSQDENGITIIDDEFKDFANHRYNDIGTIFEDYSNVYAPIYHLLSVDKILGILEGNKNYQPFIDYIYDSVSRADAYAALDYYFNNVNNGKPFILAGHSQGAIILSIVLSEYFKVHPEYLKRMIAAYVPGFPFDNEWIKANPHLKYATGEDDTGCIISWNTEGGDRTSDNAVIPKKDAYNINPLNWKTDETYVSKDSCISSYFEGEFLYNYADAQINKKSGSLICSTCQDYDNVVEVFGDKALHRYDFNLYYGNIKANVPTRIQAYKNKKE